MNDPMVSVCIPTWNGAERLERCLSSLVEATRRVSYEVIVVDNGSSDGTPEMLRERFPWVVLLRNPDNMGFAHAINQAAQVARGKYLAFVNNDIVFINDALSALAEYLEKASDKVEVVGPQILLPGGTIQYSMSYFPSLIRFLLDAFFVFKVYSVLRRRNIPCLAVSDDLKYREVNCPVEWVIGAFMMVKRDVFIATGMFDERFFFGNEDIDFCWRIRKLGGYVCYCPEARVLHEHAGSFKKALDPKGGTDLEERTIRRQVEGWAGLEYLMSKHRGRTYAVAFHIVRRLWGISRVILWGTKWLFNLLTGKSDPIVSAYMRSSWHLVVGRALLRR